MSLQSDYDEVLSEYEKRREKQIHENKELMYSIGLEIFSHIK